MSARFDVFSVPLPSRMQVDDLLALGNQLQARYTAVVRAARRGAPQAPAGCPAAVAIPATIAASNKRLDVSLVALRRVSALRHERAESRPDTSVRSAANGASDGAWQALHGWLGAWSRRVEDGQRPSAADARVLFGKLFPAPEGLRFITWRARRQWTSMQVRMELLGDPDVGASIVALGGERLLATLTTTHEAYGRAFAFTAAKGAGVAAPAAILPQFVSAKGTLRDYVVKVTGSADPDVPQSEALAAWLLGPFHEMLAEFAAQPVARAKTPVAPAPPDAPR